jgi:hypothetical protein
MRRVKLRDDEPMNKKLKIYKNGVRVMDDEPRKEKLKMRKVRVRDDESDG